MTNLEQEHYVKYLGVLIDSHPSWKVPHRLYSVKKKSKAVGIIARLSNFLPSSNSRKALSFLNRTVYFLWTNCMGTSCQFKSVQNYNIANKSSSVDVIF